MALSGGSGWLTSCTHDQVKENAIKVKIAMALCFATGMLPTQGCAQTPAPPPPPNPAVGAPAPPPPAGGPLAPPRAATQPPGVGQSAAAPAAVLVNDNSSIRYVIYGPGGEVQALVLRNETIVSVPPDLGAQIGPVAVRGASIRVAGVTQYFGRQRELMAQNIQVGGQNFASVGPAAATPPPAPGAGPAAGPGPAGPPPTPPQ